MKSCCDHHGIDCGEGRQCPARQPAKHWCETSRQPCAQPFTCAAGCQIKSDNCLQRADQARELSLFDWALIVLLIVWAFAAVYFFYF
jgi:hypothetical protein